VFGDFAGDCIAFGNADIDVLPIGNGRYARLSPTRPHLRAHAPFCYYPLECAAS
jgi:hypothetical protein